MNLHRIEGSPEWEKVPAAQRNAWQRLAAATNGILTVGNIFSLLGLLSVPLGLVIILGNGAPIAGILVLVAGRVCDLLDGWLADRTGTKSPLGEKIDASFDKISTGLLLLVLAISAIVPFWAIVLVLVPQFLSAVISLLALRRGRPLHPSLIGKLSMGASWGSLLAFVFLETYSGFANDLGHKLVALLVGMALGMGMYAAAGYWRQYVTNVREA